MRITFDPAKRDITLADRGLDFNEIPLIFAGLVMEFEDTRLDYGEVRMVTVGYLDQRMMMVIWTPRGDSRHIISMRQANAREQRTFQNRLG